jgi:hypothetical protein
MAEIRDSLGATVTATQCEFMENGVDGVFCADANTKARLNDCMVHHNGRDGLTACDRAVVDLHGTKMDIHSNSEDGIYAASRGKVNIHLPPQHNTSHDNVRSDRFQISDGSYHGKKFLFSCFLTVLSTSPLPHPYTVYCTTPTNPAPPLPSGHEHRAEDPCKNLGPKTDSPHAHAHLHPGSNCPE